MIWRQRYRPNALSFLNQKVGIALSMETILHVHCVGSCIPLKGRLQLYAFCNTNHHGKWKQHVISPQLDWKQRAATHCNLPVFPKTDLKNHSNRGFDEMTSIVTGSFLELLLAVHDASTDCIDVSMRVGLRPILPLGAEIALTLVAWKRTLGGHPFLRHACPFWTRLVRKNNYTWAQKCDSENPKIGTSGKTTFGHGHTNACPPFFAT